MESKKDRKKLAMISYLVAGKRLSQTLCRSVRPFFLHRPSFSSNSQYMILRCCPCPPARERCICVYGLFLYGIDLCSFFFSEPSISILHFLDASTHLYMRVCPSVGPSVGPSMGPSVVRPWVRRSVGRSVTRFFTAEFNQKRHRNHGKHF